MAKPNISSVTSSPVAETGQPSVAVAPEEPGFDLFAYRESDEGRAVTKWALDEFSRCKTAKSQKQRQWYLHMAFTFGHQWLDTVAKTGDKTAAFKPKAAPPYINRRTVNRIRSFVRTEQSKFLSTLPVVSAVPSTAEEEDIRAAYAAEQVWQSYTSKNNLRREYSRAIWWMVLTGNGFLKAWWDPTVKDRTSGQPGDIRYRSVTPFHIFVPDLREREIDDQPYIIQAQVKTLEWALQFYGQELEKTPVKASQISANQLLDDVYFNLADTPKSELDSVVILEVWVKPGTTKLLPQGGLLVFVEDILVSAFTKGMPYNHDEYPYSKLEHLSNDSFYADSPLVDLVELQKEYNDIRTQIGVSAKRMGNPQLLTQQGSIIPGRMTNEPGQHIQYRPGTPPPTPLPLQPLPEYVTTQLDRIVQDFEDLSGQHEVSKGQTPAGVTAGTALAFLKESDDSFLTPQYQNVEDAFERIARQTLSLFQQFVDAERKIKTVGSDGSYDVAMLQGADINGATDVRVEPGSSIGQSMAAKRAAVMDMFATGILTDPNQALRLLEVGGAQKVLDTVSVAEKKALRENMKMKSLGKAEGMQLLQSFQQEQAMEIVEPMVQELGAMQSMEQAGMEPQLDEMGMPVEPEIDPMTGQPMGGPPPITVESVMSNPQLMQMVQEQIPPMVPADDFDMHAVHIDVHNRYRMGQEYETLPDPVKAEFDKHVTMHEMLLSEQMSQQMMMGMLPGGPDGQAPGGPGEEAGTMGAAPAGQPV